MNNIQKKSTLNPDRLSLAVALLDHRNGEVGYLRAALLEIAMHDEAPESVRALARNAVNTSGRAALDTRDKVVEISAPASIPYHPDLGNIPG